MSDMSYTTQKVIDTYRSYIREFDHDNLSRSYNDDNSHLSDLSDLGSNKVMILSELIDRIKRSHIRHMQDELDKLLTINLNLRNRINAIDTTTEHSLLTKKKLIDDLHIAVIKSDLIRSTAIVKYKEDIRNAISLVSRSTH